MVAVEEMKVAGSANHAVQGRGARMMIPQMRNAG
jgi:hypothetical protein